MRKSVRNLLLAVGCGVLAVLLVGPCSTILWVGSTDLTVEFVVTDAETAQPLHGIELFILSHDYFYDNRRQLQGLREEEFALKTDASGVAEYLCRNSMCSGRGSVLWWTNTFAVQMPYWRITVKAPGYTSPAPFYLDSQLGRNVERTGQGRSKVVVPISLSKAQP